MKPNGKTPPAAAQSPAALLEASRRELAAGNAGTARRLIEAVLARQPDSADALAGLGMACRAEGDHAGALAAFEAALKTQPGVPALIAARAEELAELGRTAEAAAAYDRLIAALPKSVRPRADKALMFQRSGDFDAAEREFRKALEIAPADGELYRVFLRTKKLGPGDPLIAAMERAWARSDLPAGSRVHLGFALAKAMEDSGQHERVFTYLRPANEGMRRAHPFDFAAREREIDGLIDAFRGYDFASLASAEPGDFGPIFVTGLPRSGTTLVEQIVSAHPEVEGGGEMAIFFREASRAMRAPGGGFRRLDAVPKADLAALAGAYEARARKALNFRERFTDKSIQTELVLGLVRLVLPQARVLLVERDPRDTLFSIYKNVFMPGKHLYSYDLRDLARFYRLHRKVVDFWREALPGGFHAVRYEELVADPEPVSRAMVAAAGLVWDPACLAFTENKRAVKTLSAHQVRQPLYASSVGAWRLYEAELAEMLDELGEVA